MNRFQIRLAVCLGVWLSACLAAAFPQKSLTAAEAPKLRVFILAGQSNMEGKGAIQHLDQLLEMPAFARWSGLKDANGWTQREDVSIKYLQRQGKLTVGYGMPDQRIGPELGFGHVVGDRFDEHVLLIKTAWGGRSLAVDFRSPSSGIGQFQRRDRQSKELVPIPAEEYGTAYREMLKEVQDALDSIESYVPPDVASDGYELSGFVWFQGFNDIINAEFTSEYESCLANLIRDVRKDLGVPELPVVIGELGQQGIQPEKRYEAKHLNFRRIQKSVAERSEFKRTVAFVKTSPFVIGDEESFDGGYHYYGRADTFLNIGEAFGKAMLLMCHDLPVNHASR